MPFEADTRCGTWTIKLNTNVIAEELERMLERPFQDSTKRGSKFWNYVEDIEDELCTCDTMPDFWEWFLENYMMVPTWDLVDELFYELEEEEELDICGETGREFDIKNQVKGCGKKITEEDENIMIGNISYCCECGENEPEERFIYYYCRLSRVDNGEYRYDTFKVPELMFNDGDQDKIDYIEENECVSIDAIIKEVSHNDLA